MNVWQRLCVFGGLGLAFSLVVGFGVRAQGPQIVPGPPASRQLPVGCTNGQAATYTAATGLWSCANGTIGVAAGYKVARAETALDGNNPTPVATGLTTIVACTVTLKGTAAPGVGTSVLTGNINGTSFDVYAWKVTAAGDATLIASTGTESFYTVCVGT